MRGLPTWSRLRAAVRRSCWPLLPMVAAVLAAGGVVQASVAGGDSFPWSHGVRVAAGVVVGCAVAAWGARRVRAAAWPLYVMVLAMLVLVLLVGRETNQARRWLDVAAGVKLQPSEFMKLALILVLARWFAERPRPRRLRDLAAPVALTAVPAFLVLVEPDLGTTLVFAPLFLSLAWLAGTPWRAFRWLLVAPLAVAPAGWLVLHDYQRERVLTWWFQDALTPAQKAAEGYHLWHAKLAVGSGRLTGHGWSEGPENRLGLLPERHNDFVFPVIAEELGFLGATAFLLLYALPGFYLLAVAGRFRDPFTRLALAGIGAHFLFHLLVNVGVSIGLWPTTGLPLPMVSFGGSSMLVSGMAVGAALALSASREPALSARAFEP